MLILIASCQPKSTPVISSRNTPPPQIKKQVYPPTANVIIDLEKGKQLYISSCKRCHGEPVVTDFTAAQWDRILPLMFPRTALNTEEAYQVRAFVLANAKSN